MYVEVVLGLKESERVRWKGNEKWRKQQQRRLAWRNVSRTVGRVKTWICKVLNYGCECVGFVIETLRRRLVVESREFGEKVFTLYILVNEISGIWPQ